MAEYLLICGLGLKLGLGLVVRSLFKNDYCRQPTTVKVEMFGDLEVFVNPYGYTYMQFSNIENVSTIWHNSCPSFSLTVRKQI